MGRKERRNEGGEEGRKGGKKEVREEGREEARKEGRKENSCHAMPDRYRTSTEHNSASARARAARSGGRLPREAALLFALHWVVVRPPGPKKACCARVRFQSGSDQPFDSSEKYICYVFKIHKRPAAAAAGVQLFQFRGLSFFLD